MPFFVSSLRAVDDWKRIHAKRADAITQAELEANANYVKSPFARSVNVEDLLRFLDDTVLDINFMVQLPSIEKCLEKWWRLYARDKHVIDQDTLRNVYYDLAFVLVEAKTEAIHKNSVSMIMRSSWTKWSSKEPPLGKSEFFRLLFILAHLMTATDRLNDYVIFFQDTMSKIGRNYRQKQIRTEQRSRRPRIRRKSTLDEIFKNGGSISPKLVSERDRVQPATLSHSSASPNQILNVQMGRVPLQNEVQLLYDPATLSEDEDQGGDCFVELLERKSRYQRVVVDPLLNDRRFQEKFRFPGGGVNANTTSMNDMLIALNPTSNKYCPPLLASRLRTKPSPSPSRSSAFNQLPATTGVTEQGNRTQPAISSNQASSSLLNGVLPSSDPMSNIRDASEQKLYSSRSTPAIVNKHSSSKQDVIWNSSTSNDTLQTPREEELMRRSLSRVTLKTRVERNRTAGEERLKNRGHETLWHSPKKEEKEKEGIYLAIST
ncbi:hypothetical protein ON010_g8884 [Phytophthora cinnamomi]|nr:hypothetical protein ON010_g8884 [Phytophthora cinnamomi]